MVWNASNAAFTDTTDNGSNTFNTGNIDITDDDSTAVMYNAQNLVPGATPEVRCINVTYNGTISSSSVKLYASSGSSTNSLEDYIDLTIEQGTATGNSFPGCGTFTPGGAAIYTGELGAFRSSVNSHATGVDSWSPTNGQNRVYRFTVQLQSTAPVGVMNSSAQVTFQWEAKVGT